MICLMLSQVRFRVAGSCAIAFQKLLIQSVFRVAMMSSYTARTSGLASLYSINPSVDMRSPRSNGLLVCQMLCGEIISLLGPPARRQTVSYVVLLVVFARPNRNNIPFGRTP